MHGLMMDVPLSIPGMLRRTRLLYSHKEIVSRRPDRSIHRYTYGECLERSGRLALALRRLGIQPGDRVGTLAWNHWRHLECYYAIPAARAVLHTLNLRLHPDDISYIANHAGDRVVFVDKVLWPLWEKCADRVRPEHVVVMSDDGTVPPGALEYESLLAAEDEDFDFADIDEREACGMCYTSGTTGRPKGVLYSHRSTVLHALGLSTSDAVDLRERDCVLAVVPMFHAMAWGLPYIGAMTGSEQVHPGPHLDPANLLHLFESERVTLGAGVPTIWLGILNALDAAPGKYDLSALHTLLVGGAAAPESMIRSFHERHGLRVMHAWGMTELSPAGTVSVLRSDEEERLSDDEKYALRASQGIPLPLVEIRARNEAGFVPWDGRTMGELEVRGPWVASAYFGDADESSDKFTDDGWFRTGDIVSIEPRGYVRIQDRSKDVIKSGGEWISSQALENALMAHPAVAEAAVVGIPHPKWDERPLACIVVRPGHTAPTKQDVYRFLDDKFAKWWYPDEVVVVPAIPKTSVGKIQKIALRETFRTHYGVDDPSSGGGAADPVKATTA
jgi:fatty-acyl-CoA synthase